MDRINRIFHHPAFQEYVFQNGKCEWKREFCRHNLSHFMDVARIGYILNMEENYGFSRDMIYGAALLHDIGRFVQYREHRPHALVSAELAPQILSDCGYNEEESALIVSAISTHSDKSLVKERTLNGLLARADQMSRACYGCGSSAKCDWDEERKNAEIQW
ncbi:MAG: HD domain-containing protein [Lachnospiraceae bacterium]|nr:HD domain-containing protein [Lachnospiraceae bacterium]